MDSLDAVLARGRERPCALSHDELARLASLSDPEEREALRAAAYEVKLRVSGPVVSLRGLVEIGNVCAKNCYYCGLRRDNALVRRFAPRNDFRKKFI